MTGQIEPSFYKIILTLKSGFKVESIEFKCYPPHEAIYAGVRLFNPISWEVKEFYDED
jgi:hypothetical protein